ncbi:hypothetical protein IEQ34_008054 [Dendrobium chrysotoxum]|uniref:Uncharacterized protein n=1 Tax=Dendrobium chrysotoxum TaxID=161865 RepID=A0AAV7H6E3_DENCH|nr:hypothetical protein IEQ34_008054 [Dendrobium chrysotoxum]
MLAKVGIWIVNDNVWRGCGQLQPLKKLHKLRTKLEHVLDKRAQTRTFQNSAQFGSFAALVTAIELSPADLHWTSIWLPSLDLNQIGEETVRAVIRDQWSEDDLGLLVKERMPNICLCHIYGEATTKSNRKHPFAKTSVDTEEEIREREIKSMILLHGKTSRGVSYDFGFTTILDVISTLTSDIIRILSGGPVGRQRSLSLAGLQAQADTAWGPWACKSGPAWRRRRVAGRAGKVATRSAARRQQQRAAAAASGREKQKRMLRWLPASPEGGIVKKRNRTWPLKREEKEKRCWALRERERDHYGRSSDLGPDSLVCISNLSEILFGYLKAIHSQAQLIQIFN